MAKNKKTIFEGAATALVTPLTENGIDYDAFGKLIDWQIESGIDALVVCGTTGEASTLTDDEVQAQMTQAMHLILPAVLQNPAPMLCWW